MGKEKIVVVDDDQSLQELIGALLMPMGFDGVTLAMGKDVVEAIHEEEARAVILDYLMPVKNGIELAKEIRTHEDLAEFPVFLLTSKVLDEEELRRVGELNLIYLTKPFMPQVFVATLRKALYS